MTWKLIGFMPSHIALAMRERGASAEEVRATLDRLIEHDPLRYKMGFGPSAPVEFDANALRQ